MHYKRETSVSVSDLQMNTVNDSIKRLAISQDGHPQVALSIKHPAQEPSVVTVMSQARGDFHSKYDILGEIGKGGFSTVYQCKNRSTGMKYAVKVVDLRPLRLRERFNPARLRREVDIMRRLNHPNIIQFEEVYEDEDNLMMVMEYCPGQELFDVILARKFFQEEDAKPIFAQIARALFYLHTLNIIHRDIKPENVLILNTPDPKTGGLVAKLLDFGLSKNAAAGSAAKTFVGTPCYLAPEVEYTSKGLGGTYGLPADCWSLGAVLYVMLVARFPEFEQDVNGKIVVKLPPNLWNNISTDAKELIRSLMNTNPAARLSAAGALLHPWLGRYRATEEELKSVTISTTEFSNHLQYEEEMVAAAEENNGQYHVGDGKTAYLTAGGAAIQQQAMVIRQSNNPQAFGPQQLQLAPLLHLQRSIATCFEEAHRQYQFMPEVSTQVRRAAILCRQQLVESTIMLKKVEQTAKEVLGLFPDLELAVEEEEPKLAAEFFNLVKGWVIEMRELVTNTQKINRASMNQIQKVVEQSTRGILQANNDRKHRIEYANQNVPNGAAVNKNTVNIPKQLLETLMEKLSIKDDNNTSGSTNSKSTGSSAILSSIATVAGEGGENVELDANQILELFVTLFSSQPKQNFTTANSSNSGKQPPTSSKVASKLEALYEIDDVEEGQITPNDGEGGTEMVVTGVEIDIGAEDAELPVSHDDNSDENQGSYHTTYQESSATGSTAIIIPPKALKFTSVPSPDSPPEIHSAPTASDHLNDPSSPRAAARLGEALQKLRQVDAILDHLNIFWANTEVILHMLTKKGQHVEQFIGFASKPRLMARFRERMEEYKRFWEDLQLMCAKYIAGVQVANESQKMYGFLEQVGLGERSGSNSSSMEKGDSTDSLNSNSLFGDQNTLGPTFAMNGDFQFVGVHK